MSTTNAERSQRLAGAIWAALHVHEVVRQGWVETGWFQVDEDAAWGSLRLAVAVDGVTEPDRTETVDRALRMMQDRGHEMDPVTVGVVAELLQMVDLEWPA